MNNTTHPRSRSLLRAIGLGAAAVLLVGAGAGAGDLAAQGVDITTLGYNQGNATAPIRIVEFSDFGCEFCRQFHQDVFPTIKEEYIDAGKVAWKYIPVSLSDFPNSDEASIAGECAADQGLFFQMREVLFDRQAQWQAPANPTQALVETARLAGLNTDRFAQCLNVERGELTIENNTRVAAQTGVRHTPTFLVLGNGEMKVLPGALPLDLFREALEEALAGG